MKDRNWKEADAFAKTIRVGMQVTTPFIAKEANVVRTVTTVRRVTKGESQTGRIISADGGVACSACGHTPGTPIHEIDGAWFDEAPSQRKKKPPTKRKEP